MAVPISLAQHPSGQIALRRTDGTPPRFFLFLSLPSVFNSFFRNLLWLLSAATSVHCYLAVHASAARLYTHTHMHIHARASLDENFRQATEAGTGTAGIFEARFVIETGRGSHKAARVHSRVLSACCCEMSLHTWAAWSLVIGTTLQIIDRRTEQCLNNVFILTIERGQRAVVYPRPSPSFFAPPPLPPGHRFHPHVLRVNYSK